MQPALIIGMILSFAFVRGEFSAPADAAPARLVVIASLLAAVVLTSQAIAAHARRLSLRDAPRRGDRVRRFRWMRTAHFLLWGGVVWYIQSPLEWPRLVCCNWGLEGAVLLDELLLLLPALVPLAFSQVAFTAVDAALDSPGIDSRHRPMQTARLLLQHVWSPVLIPVLVLAAGRDLYDVLLPDAIGSQFAWCVWAVPAAAIAVTFPALLGIVWGAEPLPAGPLRRRLAHTARRVGVPLRRIHVWHTEGRIANAAVVGILAPLRTVFLSDGLLGRLGDRQVEAVFAHELGHIRHRHALRRIALVGTMALGATAVVAGCPNGIVQVALPFAFGIAMLPVLGWYSRQLEHQADLRAVITLSSGRRLTSVAAERLIDALTRLVGPEPRDARGEWLHPSIARRAAFLDAAIAEPTVPSRLHRRLRAIDAVMLLTAIAAVCSLPIIRP